MPRIYIAHPSVRAGKLNALPAKFVNPRLTAPQARYLAWLYEHDDCTAMPERSSEGREEQILTTLTTKKLLVREDPGWRLTPLGRQVAGYFR